MIRRWILNVGPVAVLQNAVIDKVRVYQTNNNVPLSCMYGMCSSETEEQFDQNATCLAFVRENSVTCWLSSSGTECFFGTSFSREQRVLSGNRAAPVERVLSGNRAALVERVLWTYFRSSILFAWNCITVAFKSICSTWLSCYKKLTQFNLKYYFYFVRLNKIGFYQKLAYKLKYINSSL